MICSQRQTLFMPKLRLLMLSALLVVPAWSQSQPPAAAKGPIHSAKKSPARAAVDLTARLQAQAIADAAAAAAASAVNAESGAKPPDTPAALEAVATDALAKEAAFKDTTFKEAIFIDTSVKEVIFKDTSVKEVFVRATPAVLAAPQTAALLTPATQMAKPDSASLSPEMAIAQQIHQGLLPCELGASVRVEADAALPGHFNVQGKGFRYRMYPVPTSTGALRLEDKKAGAVWLQLANKSMLMDQKKGRRMVDECAHPTQVAYDQATKTKPPPDLFVTTGMGRAPH